VLSAVKVRTWRVEDAVCAQFKDVVVAFNKPTYGQLRIGRNQAQYFDPSVPDKTESDAQWVLSMVQSVPSEVRQLIESGRLGLYG
jgi:hypothetical protein